MHAFKLNNLSIWIKVLRVEFTYVRLCHSFDVKSFWSIWMRKLFVVRIGFLKRRRPYRIVSYFNFIWTKQVWCTVRCGMCVCVPCGHKYKRKLLCIYSFRVFSIIYVQKRSMDSASMLLPPQATEMQHFLLHSQWMMMMMWDILAEMHHLDLDRISLGNSSSFYQFHDRKLNCRSG